MRRPLKNNRGVALLITVTITTIIVAATLEMNRKVRTSVTATATTRDRFTLSYMAAAGVTIAMAMLIKDKKSDPRSGLDSIQEDWADPEKISEVLQDIPFEEGSVTFAITDELGKIQMNALLDKYPVKTDDKIQQRFNASQHKIWDNLLRPIVSLDEKRELNATTNIINSLKDWLDSGDDDMITGLNGAESDYYQGLTPPYSCRNGPIPHPDELMMVKGITPDLFDGNEEIPDISKYLTVYGLPERKPNSRKKTFTYEGKININTADLPVLTAIMPPENAEYAQAIYDYRGETTEDSGSGKHFVNDVSRPTWYKNAPGIPGDFKIDPRIITIKSDIFRIASTATLHEIKLTVTAVVQRVKNKKTGKWKCEILRWQTG